MRGRCVAVAGIPAWRKRCQGAAARRVSSTLRRWPARGSPLRAPTGRPRKAFFCMAPALPELGVLVRCNREILSRASRPAGMAACAASSTRSPSVCPACGSPSGASSLSPSSPSCAGSGSEPGGGLEGGSVWFSWLSGGSGGGSCASVESGGEAGGKRVARGASTSRAATAVCSSSTESQPARAAAARATLAANTLARKESMPSASAAAHRALASSGGKCTCASRARAASTSWAVHWGPSSSSTLSPISRRKARRSARLAGMCSSSLAPSSSATKASREA